MRRTVSSLAVLALLLSACDPAIQELTTRAKVSRSDMASRTRATPTPTPAPSASPETALPSPSPTPTPVATPTVPSTILSGMIRLDPSYIISTGGGNIISTGGGNIIATGGGNIIAAGGGNIIAAGGGNIIATGGGNIIAAGGGNYRTLFDAAEADMLPVQGMIVVAVSLLTREQIAPAVKTDETGSYTLAIPDSVWKDPAHKENIRIYAAVPAESPDDPILDNPRLRYEQVVEPESAATPTLDEDVNQVTRYIYRIYQGHMATVLGDSTPFNLAGLPEPFKTQFTELIARYQQVAKEASLTKAEVPEAADRVARYVLAKQQLDELEISKFFTIPGTWDGEDNAPMMPVLTDFMQKLRTAAKSWMATAPTAPTPPFVAAANAERAPEDAFEILKPSDVCEVIVDEYFVTDDADFSRLQEALDELGMKEDIHRKRIGAAGRCLWVNLGIFLQEHETEVQDILREYRKESN